MFTWDVKPEGSELVQLANQARGWQGKQLPRALHAAPGAAHTLTPASLSPGSWSEVQQLAVVAESGWGMEDGGGGRGQGCLWDGGCAGGAGGGAGGGMPQRA